jgi:hypothetical protein
MQSSSSSLNSVPRFEIGNNHHHSYCVSRVTRPLRLQKSAALLEHAKMSLERAYEALTIDGALVRPVPVERLNWLATARRLATYETLKHRIRVRTHRVMVDDHKHCGASSPSHSTRTTSMMLATPFTLGVVAQAKSVYDGHRFPGAVINCAVR